jgi:peptidoglycan/xylan/chitin deacetylase (PgdA/CDA1 family)
MSRPFSVDKLISRSGQNSFFPFYHAVSPQPLPHINHLYRVLNPEEFERDLDQLLQWYEPVSLGDYLEHSSEHSGKRTMVLTFDDGLKECHQVVAPILKRKGVPAAFFLNNQFIDNRGLFYRYKASLLIDRIRKDSSSMQRAAVFLKIPEKKVEESVLMMGYGQRALLDLIAGELELDFSDYLQSNPVYMNTREVKELLGWGFDIGGHSAEHQEFSGMEPPEMILQVTSSLVDLEERFGTSGGYFSFPFTSDGVPEKVIDTLLEEKIADALLGSAGLKRTGKTAFIQRVPMEQFEAPALNVIKAEYLSFLLKRVAGRDHLRF